jgi:endonuclease I
MKQLYTLVATLLCSATFAQIPAGYYNTAQGLTLQPLRTALHNIITGHSVKSYASLYTHFAVTDKITIGGAVKVWDIYSYNPVNPAATAYYYSYGSGTCGNYAVEGDCYNREHSWPQSWFNSTSGPQTDMFHLYPTDGKVNGLRSNYPFGNVTTATDSTTNGSRLGTGTNNAGYASIVFEPVDEYKGDLARGYFYMTTRYYTEDASWANSGATTKCEINPWQLSVLMDWHHQDPVSTKEINRNNGIYGIQNNRNPFIDHPEWADSIWPNAIIVTSVANAMQQATKVTAFPNPTTDVVTLQNIANNSSLALYNAQGKLIYTEQTLANASTTLNLANYPKGLYMLRVSTATTNQTVPIIKQ